MKRLLTFTILPILLIAAIPAHGQDNTPPSETYHSAYFYLQFDYPADWHVIDQLGGPLLLNYDYRNHQPNEPGQARMQFITAGDLIARGANVDTSGAVEFLDSLRPVFDRDDDNRMGLATALALTDYPAARADGMFRGNPTVYLAVSVPVNARLFISGEALDGEFAEFEPLFLQIAASARYEPPQFADTLPVIVPANAAQIARYKSLTAPGQGSGQTEHVALSPDNLWAASALGFDGVKLWNATTGELVHYFDAVRASQISFAPAGDQLVAVDYDNGLQVITLATGEVSVIESEDQLRAVAFTPDGQQIVTGGNSGAIRVWDAESLAVVRTLAELDGTQIIAVSAAEAYVAATHTPGEVALYPLNSTDPPRLLPIGESRADALAFSADGARLAVLTTDARYVVFDVATGEPLLEGRAGDDRASKPSIVLNDDGSLLVVTTSGDGLIWLIDVATGDILAELSQGGDEVSALALSTGGTRLLAGGFYDETLTLWAVP